MRPMKIFTLKCLRTLIQGSFEVPIQHYCSIVMQDHHEYYLFWRLYGHSCSIIDNLDSGQILIRLTEPNKYNRTHIHTKLSVTKYGMIKQHEKRRLIEVNR